MNITDAKAIPLYQLVQHLGGTYSHTDRSKQMWFLSPFRPNEKTASFKINEQTNKWFDFGHAARTSSGNGSGGDVIDLYCDYHGLDRRSAVKQALEALHGFASPVAVQRNDAVYKRPQTRIAGDAKQSDGQARFKIGKRYASIAHPGLVQELQKRRISTSFANRYLKQVALTDVVYPEKKRTGFGFCNDKGGAEVSCPNPAKGVSFKTSTRPKAPTTFRALASNKVFVFEGFWDFLSWMEIQDTLEPEHNIVVLNSLSFCGESVANIIAAKESLETVILFLDNDDAGRKAMHFMAGELVEAGFTVRTMETLYQHYKDLSDYWAKDPAAKKVTEQQEAAAKYYSGDSATTMVMNRNTGRPRFE